MAVVRAKSSNTEMTLRPYRLLEEGQPSWLLVQLALKHDGAELFSTTISVTREDLAELRGELNAVLTGHRTEFAMTTTDGDFIFEAQRKELPSDVAVAFWTGEPYDLMIGYRFVAVDSEVARFVRDLQLDENTVGPRSRLA